MVGKENQRSSCHLPILLLHECEITNEQSTLTEEYREKMKEYHKERAQSYFKKQIDKFGSTLYKYSEITFHIILFPVPAKKEIVGKFISNVEHFKQQ